MFCLVINIYWMAAITFPTKNPERTSLWQRRRGISNHFPVASPDIVDHIGSPNRII